jgi:ATP-dependent exoDNAse (exonuclease V) alpha subunit
VRTDAGRPIAISAAYADAGHVQHGYAITGHQSQGATVDRAFVLAPDAGRLKEWGYVAFSRAREETRVVLSAAELPTQEREPAGAVAAFVRHLEAAGREELAMRQHGLGLGLSR